MCNRLTIRKVKFHNDNEIQQSDYEIQNYLVHTAAPEMNFNVQFYTNLVGIIGFSEMKSSLFICYSIVAWLKDKQCYYPVLYTNLHGLLIVSFSVIYNYLLFFYSKFEICLPISTSPRVSRGQKSYGNIYLRKL